MFSFTLRPKYARRTRNAAWSSCKTWSSSALRTDRASPRLSNSPARALSASVSQRPATSTVASSDMYDLPGANRGAGEGADVDVGLDEHAQALARELALEQRRVAEDGNACEPLDQPRVVRRALVGCAVQDDAEGLDPQPARGEHGQRGWIDGAETGTGDDEHRQAERSGEVGDRPVLAHRDEEAAGALHDHRLVPLGDCPHACDGLDAVDRAALELGGDERRQRRGEAVRRDLLGGLRNAGPALEEHPVPVRIVRARAALDRLDDADRVSAGAKREHDSGGQHGLADTRVRAGDEEAVHAPVTSVMAWRRIEVIASRSACSLASGGMKTTTSPSGRVSIPSSRARMHTRCPVRSRHSKGSFVARSATSSIPTISPRWRTSPTCGSSATPASRPATKRLDSRTRAMSASCSNRSRLASATAQPS